MYQRMPSANATANQITRLMAPKTNWARSRASRSAVVFTNRVEAVDRDHIGQAFRTVRHTARDGVAVARTELTHLLADAEAHAAGDDVADLLVRMRVRRNRRTSLDLELHDHQFLAA